MLVSLALARFTTAQRTGRRELLNLSSLLPFLPPTTSLVQLESLPLPHQYPLFPSTNILITQYGSGGHNSVFLKDGSVLILLLQPGWCDFTWCYANQALLSNVSVIAICPQPLDREVESFRFTHKAWWQGPWNTKDASYEVDEGMFEMAVGIAKEWVEEVSKGAGGQAGKRV